MHPRTLIHRLRWLLTAAVFATFVASPLLARAEDKGLDEVALQNGGMVKGEILVMEPGEKVVIQVPGEDQPRTIPWSEVSDVVRGNERAASEKPTAEKEADAKEPHREGRVVKLHIESENPDVYLVEHRTSGRVATAYGTIVAVQSDTVCYAPCNKEIEVGPDRRYTIAGDGMSSSDDFALHQYQGDVTATVDPGSRALKGLGIAAIAVGGAAMVAGVVTTTFAYTDHSHLMDPAAKVAGPILIAGGTPLVVGGIVMLALSGTDVEIEPKAPRTRKQARTPNYWRGEF